MKSISIHNIDSSLFALIREQAKNKGVSINQFVKELLEKALGIKKEKKAPYQSEFDTLCGVWTKEDRVEFEKSIKDLDQIDPEDWK